MGEGCVGERIIQVDFQDFGSDVSGWRCFLVLEINEVEQVGEEMRCFWFEVYLVYRFVGRLGVIGCDFRVQWGDSWVKRESEDR